MAAYQSFRCDCGASTRKVLYDLDAYVPLPPGWGYGTRPLDAPVCPDCRKKKEIS
jgi:hypothetical protein